MLDVKAAVARAVEFASESLGPERTANVRLEEVETAERNGRPTWEITLSNPLPEQGTGIAALRAAFGADSGREYKVFTVAKDSGEVLAMKIRILQPSTTR